MCMCVCVCVCVCLRGRTEFDMICSLEKNVCRPPREGTWARLVTLTVFNIPTFNVSVVNRKSRKIIMEKVRTQILNDVA